MKNIDLTNVEEAQDYKRVIAGGYICKIIEVEDFPDDNYLNVKYDIVEGEFKDYYKKLNEARKFWGGQVRRYYTEKSLPHFKAFVTAIERSNDGFKFSNNEQLLVGKLIGLVLGEEEYVKNDGTLSTRLYVDKCRSISEIRKGIEPPKFKELKKDIKKQTTYSEFSDDEVPFY